MKGKARYTHYIEEDYVRIEIISNHNVVHEVLVDLETLDQIKGFSISFSGRYIIYYTNKIKKSILAKYILGITEPNIRIKYLNGNMSDLRKKNLSATEIIIPTIKKSKVKGVSWDEQTSKWKAKFSYKGETYYLGLFNSEQLAISAIIMKKIQIIEANKHH